MKWPVDIYVMFPWPLKMKHLCLAISCPNKFLVHQTIYHSWKVSWGYTLALPHCTRTANHMRPVNSRAPHISLHCSNVGFDANLRPHRISRLRAYGVGISQYNTSHSAWVVRGCSGTLGWRRAGEEGCSSCFLPSNIYINPHSTSILSSELICLCHFVLFFIVITI